MFHTSFGNIVANVTFFFVTIIKSTCWVDSLHLWIVIVQIWVVCPCWWAEEHMYRVCHNYLLIKPRMEMELVPEFFRLFYSSSQQVRIVCGTICTIIWCRVTIWWCLVLLDSIIPFHTIYLFICVRGLLICILLKYLYSVQHFFTFV